MINVTHLSREVGVALVEQSTVADLLVLGCHYSEPSWSIRSGPAADIAMRNAHCPVMLVGLLAAADPSAPCIQAPVSL
jgi:nucleotide-binding universal stress UspA family protein